MKNTNKMVNIESNPLNGSSFMNDLRNKYMEKQTAVEWIVNKLSITFQTMYSKEIEQAKEMEKEQRMMAYNAGHADGLCNHINDADNYINEQNYLKGENID
jgi:protein associated with RNAse G/E